MLFKLGIVFLFAIHRIHCGEVHTGDETESSQEQDIVQVESTGNEGDTSNPTSTAQPLKLTTSTNPPSSILAIKPTAPEPIVITRPDIGKFHQNQRLFSGDLYHRVLEMAKKDENIFFSPYSISHALGAVNAGARKQSSIEIKEALKMPNFSADLMNALFKFVTDDKFSDKEKTDVIVIMAARSFIQKGFLVNQNYVDTLQLYYNNGIERMDFVKSKNATSRINNWVESNTNKLIKDLIPEGMITGLTKMVLVNVLYFKAPWESKFLELKSETFHAPSGKIKVPYIYRKGTYRILEKNDVIYVAVPYKDKKTYFFIMMPKNDKAMKNFQRKPNIKREFRFLRMSITQRWKPKSVTLFIPKFTTEQSLDMKKVLKGMGVNEIFDPINADLSGVSKTFLYVSDFVHKARITVNEEGTEAAAASAVVMSARSLSKNLFINRPFTFGVFEESGDLLFVGKMVNPTP